MANYRWAKVLVALALALGVTASSLGIFVATHSNTASAHTVFTPKVSAKKGPQLQIVDLHTVDAAAIPQASQSAIRQANRGMPVLGPSKNTKVSLAQRKAAAPHNAGESLLSSSTSGPKTVTPDFPSTFNKFAGQSESSCGNSFCTETNPAIAAAPTGLALQVVDDTLDLYNNNGVQQSGWPKTAPAFFGVPNPTPSACDPKGPFLFYPRAWFDAYDNRFGVAIVQLEGADGVATSCTEVTKVWVATSTSTNPSGTWRVFSFNMDFGADSTAWANTLQFGFDAEGIYFTSNMYTTGGSFEYAEMVGCGKQGIYGGSTPVCNTYYELHLTNIDSQTVELDTIAPVESLSTDFSPHAEFLVDTFNFEGDADADNCNSTACNGIVVWTWSDPANTSGIGNLLQGFVFSTVHSYVIPPNADEPSCTGGGDCLFDGYTGIVGTPTYHAGHIFAAQETGVTNASSQLVSGIQWFDFEPTLETGWPTVLSGGTLVQDGILNASNNFLSCINPVIMPDLDNDLILGYDYTGDTQNPSINFTFRRVTDNLSTLPGGLGIVEVSGTATTSNFPWGLYSSMSYPATYQDFVWLTSVYATSSSPWNTELLKLRFNLNG